MELILNRKERVSASNTKICIKTLSIKNERPIRPTADH